jgi:hypothetical protein
MEQKSLQTSDLSIMKYFDEAKLVEQGKSVIGKWRNGEKPLGAIVGLTLLGVGGWALIKFVVIPALAIMSVVIATILSVVAVLFTIMLSPVIYKLFRTIVRSLHKRLIRWKPFEELDRQLAQMWRNHEAYLSRKAIVKKLRNQFEQRSKDAEKEANDAKNEVSRQVKKAGEIKQKMEQLVLEKGDSVKETDEYVELQQSFINATSAGNRLNSTMEKNIEWTKKYASRSNILANLDRKLAIGATLAENKNMDFEESIKMMKIDFEGATAMRGATDYLKQLLLGNKQNWQLEYAVEFVTNQVQQELALTSQNLEDLDRNISAFNFDSDDAYDKLLEISNKIDAGQIVVPDANRISNPNHKLTSEEKDASKLNIF